MEDEGSRFFFFFHLVPLRVMKRIVKGFLPLLFLLALALSVEAKEIISILKVVDGDTLLVNYKGKEEHIRLIGIDTPESRPNKKGKSDAQRSGEDLKVIISQGKKATRFLKALVRTGDKLTIEFDVQIRDKYGRLLGYVYLSTGRMLNEEIAGAGYANPMTVPPNVKYQARVLKAYREARENRRGLWR